MDINSTNNQNNGVLIFAFGGLNEVGKNSYCIETRKVIILLDMGVKFFKIHDNFIKCVIPDMKYLNFSNKIKILVITHGHEDHIGGILFLIKNVNVSIIYAPRLAVELIRNKIRNSHFKGRVTIVEYNNESFFNIVNGEVKISFFSVTHSIPDSYGVVVDTLEGRIVTTGDFKVDLTPVNNINIELNKIAVLGNEKIDLLMSDSTNAMIDGFSTSERSVYNALDNIFCRSQGRIIVTTFSSSLLRIQQIFSIAKKYNRKIAIIGKSMEFSVNIALKDSASKNNEKKRNIAKLDRSLIIDVKDVDKYKLKEVCVICTGSQGEKNSALSKIISGESKVHIIPGDTVIFSSGVIPGNNEDVEYTTNLLSKFGANIFTNDIVQIHSSGHPCKQDLMLMLKLFNPAFFMPIHGDYHMLKEHANVAIFLGMKKENTFVLDNGNSLILKNHNIVRGRDVQVSTLYLDDNSDVVPQNIIFEKNFIRENGIIIVNVFVSKTRYINANVITKGFILNDIEIIKSKIDDVLKQNMPNFFKKNNDQIKKITSDLIENIIRQISKKKPLIVPIILNNIN